MCLFKYLKIEDGIPLLVKAIKASWLSIRNLELEPKCIANSKRWKGRTLCYICSKNLIEWENPPRIFTLLQGIHNHDISIFSNVINCGLPIRLPWKKWSNSTVNSDCPCEEQHFIMLQLQKSESYILLGHKSHSFQNVMPAALVNFQYHLLDLELDCTGDDFPPKFYDMMKQPLLGPWHDSLLKDISH